LPFVSPPPFRQGRKSTGQPRVSRTWPRRARPAASLGLRWRRPGGACSVRR